MRESQSHSKPDFVRAVSAARELLLFQDKPKNFRTDVKRLSFPEPHKIDIASFEHICTVTGVSVKQLSGGGTLWDGYAVIADGADGVPDTVMILYGDGDYEEFLRRQSGFPARSSVGGGFEKYGRFSKNTRSPFPRGNPARRARKSWTIAHEIGHILLSHVDDGEVSEVEANFFASELLMPSEVLSALSVRIWGGAFPVSEIVRYFAVSQTAALHRAKSLERSTAAGYADGGGPLLRKYEHLIEDIENCRK